MTAIYKVIAGTFEGTIGALTSAPMNGIYLLTVANGDRVSVTKKQIEIMPDRSANFENDFIRGAFNGDMSQKYGFNSGGYEKHYYFITADGGILSIESVRENIDKVDFNCPFSPDWYIIGGGVNYEDQDLVCSHSNEKIEPAYTEE